MIFQKRNRISHFRDNLAGFNIRESRQIHQLKNVVGVVNINNPKTFSIARQGVNGRNFGFFRDFRGKFTIFGHLIKILLSGGGSLTYEGGVEGAE